MVDENRDVGDLKLNTHSLKLPLGYRFVERNYEIDDFERQLIMTELFIPLPKLPDLD